MENYSQFAVILGASRFPKAPKLGAGRAFYNSATDFMETLMAPKGLGIAEQDICWLFDDGRSPSDQLEDVAAFLYQRNDRLRKGIALTQDLILFYVGHGLFTRNDKAYCLAVRATNENNEGPTSIRAADLATVIKENARFARRFLIFDCCFAASFYREFQSAPLSLARSQMLQELPTRGTALLCSSSAREPSLAPQEEKRTMFSEALMTSLQRGSVSLGSRLSFSELGALVRENLQAKFPDTWIRPEVLAPDQRDGDISDIPLFPNFSYRTDAVQSAEKNASSTQKNLAEQQRKEEEEAKAAEQQKEKNDLRRWAEAERLKQEAEQEETRRREELEAQRQAVEAERLKREPAAKEKEYIGVAPSFLRRGRTRSALMLWSFVLVSVVASSYVAWRVFGVKQLSPAKDPQSSPEQIALPQKPSQFQFQARDQEGPYSRVAILKDPGGGPAHSVAFLPSRPVLAVIDDTVDLWDLSTQSKLKSWPTQYLWAIWTTRSEELVTAGMGGLVYWNLSGKVLGRTTLGEDWVKEVAIEPSSGVIAAAFRNVINICDPNTKKVVQTFTGHRKDVRGLAFSKNIVASGGLDQTLKIWNVETGKLEETIVGFQASVEAVALSPDAARVATVDDTGALRIWNVATGKETTSVSLGKPREHGWWKRTPLTWSPDGRYIACSFDFTELRDAQTGGRLQTLRDHDASAIAFNATGDQLALNFRGWDHAIWVWSRTK